MARFKSYVHLSQGRWKQPGLISQSLLHLSVFTCTRLPKISMQLDKRTNGTFQVHSMLLFFPYGKKKIMNKFMIKVYLKIVKILPISLSNHKLLSWLLKSMSCGNQSWCDNQSTLFSLVSHSKSMCEMFKSCSFLFISFVIFKITGSHLINLRLYMTLWCLDGSCVIGNSIAKNFRVSVGLPSVTIVNHHENTLLRSKLKACFFDNNLAFLLMF